MNHLISFRPAERRDIDAIGRLADDADLFPPDLLGDMMSPWFQGSADDAWYVAADAGDEPVGFAFCELERLTAGTWNMLALAMHSRLRGRGLGAALVAHAETALRGAGARLLIVETLGTPAFEATRRFYRRVGYVEEARIRDFYEPGGDKVVFWKTL